jgi:hypothetical protein
MFKALKRLFREWFPSHESSKEWEARYYGSEEERLDMQAW